MKDSRKITSIDVARLAGVSQASVSMILNQKYNVSFSKETVDKVEKAAADLGYNIPKRRIHKDGKEQKLIIALCPTLTNPYYVMLIQGIEEVADENGYGVFVCNTERNPRTEEQYLKMMKSVKPLGIIYTNSPSFPSQVEELSKQIPIVIIGNRDETLEVDVVELNNKKPGKLMARHLIELGHKNVAFIAPPLTNRQQARIKRVEGFVEEFEHCVPDGTVTVKALDAKMDTLRPSIDSEYKMGYQAAKDLLKERKDLTAIVGLNDMIAFGILDALAEEKYKVPADISVVGCDNTIFSRMRGLSLTTIEHFVPLKGRDACDIIVKKINSQNTYNSEIQPTSIYHVEYEPKLIARGSTAYARK